MKIVRYGESGTEKPGLLDAHGDLRALSPVIADWTIDYLTPDALAVLKAIDPMKLPRVAGRPRLGNPIANFRQVVAIGLNYADHAREAGIAVPTYPLLFHKAIGSLSGPNDDIVIPTGSTKMDWEVELGIVIGRTASHVPAAEAFKYIAGYCLTLDMSEREWQFDRGGLLNKGKSADTFTPVGPWVCTADELPDPQALRLWLKVNSIPRQNGTTRDMIFNIAALVEHITQYQTLTPGELILTGTPAGVGFGMKPQVYLRPGDTIDCGIDLLGEQAHRVIARPAT
jgi:2,4-didehydro-3-deoxy-L-rhamnonate hydrolase